MSWCLTFLLEVFPSDKTDGAPAYPPLALKLLCPYHIPFPVRLRQVVNGFADAGAALVQSGVDKVVFTGSPAIGKHIMSGAAATLTPVVLELGGKDPFIVCDDADIDQVCGLLTHVTIPSLLHSSFLPSWELSRLFLAYL